MTTNRDEENIELSEAQQNPYLARPEDFVVGTGVDAAKRQLPGHGQCGDTLREYNHLLKQREQSAGKSKPVYKGVDLPTAPDEAGPPHTKFGRVS
jgi:hypothetical protein